MLSEVNSGPQWEHQENEHSESIDHREMPVIHNQQQQQQETKLSEGREESGSEYRGSEADGSKKEVRMTRVDWRWAAKKGFWDKEKKCWIESAGGQAAYIVQRTKRCQMREQRIARRVKAMERVAPSHGLPIRSGLIEELPDNAAGSDPWADCIRELSSKKAAAAAAAAAGPSAAADAARRNQARAAHWHGIDGPGLTAASAELSAHMPYGLGGGRAAPSLSGAGMAGPFASSAGVRGASAAGGLSWLPAARHSFGGSASEWRSGGGGGGGGGAAGGGGRGRGGGARLRAAGGAAGAADCVAKGGAGAPARRCVNCLGFGA